MFPWSSDKRQGNIYLSGHVYRRFYPGARIYMDGHKAYDQSLTLHSKQQRNTRITGGSVRCRLTEIGWLPKLRNQILTARHQKNLSTGFNSQAVLWKRVCHDSKIIKNARHNHGTSRMVELRGDNRQEKNSPLRIIDFQKGYCKIYCRSKSNFFTGSLRLLLIAMKSNFNYRKWRGDI